MLLNALDRQRYRCVLNDIREGIGSLPVDEETCVVLLGFNALPSPYRRNSRMHHDTAPIEQFRKSSIASAQVVHPHRRVDEDQRLIPDRLRGAALRFGCVPPSRASRFALSRSIRALNPS